MGMKRIPLAEATATQLREFARTGLALEDVKDNSNKQTLTAQIALAWPHDHILVSDEVEAPARSGSGRRAFNDDPANPPETATVIINVMEEPGGDRPVELAVNGKNMLVERGKEQEIPWPYYLALVNAEQHFHDPLPVNDSSPGGMNPIPRKVLRYPFTRVA